MLHYDTLMRLCRARDLLRDPHAWGRSIESIAEEVGLSTYHFIRLFKAVFGETPKQTQIAARLERAKKFLMLTERPVTEVAFEAGYSSLGTFSHVFALRTGKSPSAFRKWARSMMDIPGEVPTQLAPGCLLLMGGAPTMCGAPA